MALPTAILAECSICLQLPLAPEPPTNQDTSLLVISAQPRDGRCLTKNSDGEGPTCLGPECSARLRCHIRTAAPAKDSAARGRSSCCSGPKPLGTHHFEHQPSNMAPDPRCHSAQPCRYNLMLFWTIQFGKHKHSPNMPAKSTSSLAVRNGPEASHVTGRDDGSQFEIHKVPYLHLSIP